MNSSYTVPVIDLDSIKLTQLTVIDGPSGSGKSTLAAQLLVKYIGFLSIIEEADYTNEIKLFQALKTKISLGPCILITADNSVYHTDRYRIVTLVNNSFQVIKLTKVLRQKPKSVFDTTPEEWSEFMRKTMDDTINRMNKHKYSYKAARDKDFKRYTSRSISSTPALRSIAAYREYGVDRSTLTFSMERCFNFPNEYKDCLGLYYMLYWQTTYFFSRMDKGTLEREGKVYKIIYHKTDPASLRKGNQVKLSFRCPMPAFGLQPVVLVTAG